MIQGHFDNEKLIKSSGPDSPGSEVPGCEVPSLESFLRVDTPEVFEHLQLSIENIEAITQKFRAETLETMLSLQWQLRSNMKKDKYFPAKLVKRNLQKEAPSSKPKPKPLRATFKCVAMLLLIFGTVFAGLVAVSLGDVIGSRHMEKHRQS